MFWLPLIAAAVSAIGAGVAYVGQQRAAQATEDAAKYNAELARRKATQESAVAAENARRKARENARLLAQQRAALARSGFQMEGTPLALLGETATILERDIQDLSFEATNRVQALTSQASLSLWEGQQQSSAQRTSAYASLLGSASSATSGYLSSTGRYAP